MNKPSAHERAHDLIAEALHERFALDHEDHWRDLDDDEKRQTEAWDKADALLDLFDVYQVRSMIGDEPWRVLLEEKRRDQEATP